MDGNDRLNFVQEILGSDSRVNHGGEPLVLFSSIKEYICTVISEHEGSIYQYQRDIPITAHM